MKFELSQETQRAIIHARDMLNAEITELSKQYIDEPTAEWHMSARGIATFRWFEKLDELSDALGDFEGTPHG